MISEVKKQGERRASHDGSFCAQPKKRQPRSGSCERFQHHEPVNILELGSAPLPLTQILKATETDSSFSLKMPLSIPKAAKIIEKGVVSSEDSSNSPGVRFIDFYLILYISRDDL